MRDLLLTAGAKTYAASPPEGVDDYPACTSGSHLWLLPYSEDPIAVAHGLIAARTKADGLHRAAKERELAEIRAELLADPPSSLLRQREGYVPAIHSVPSELLDDPDVAAALDAARAVVHAEMARRDRELKAARERAKREQEEAERAYAAEREAWIAEHGSSRLRRLAAEGIEHDAVYRDERLALERPAWQWSTMQDGDTPGAEPRNVPEEALDLLDAARADDPDAVLRYLQPRRWVPHDEDPEACDDPSDCRECDEDGHHLVFGQPGYRAYATFLGRRIVTRTAVAA